MSYYPELSDTMVWQMTVIAKHIRDSGPEYLQNSPYPPEIKAIFGLVVSIESQVGELEQTIDGMDVRAELERLYKNLDETWSKLSAGNADNAEKMAYFRVATTMLEKLVALQERANNVRAIGQFHATVLAVLDECLDPSAVAKVRARLSA